MAGLRIGYAISNKDIIGYLNRVRGPFNTNTGAQVAAIAALEDQEFIEKSVQSNNQEKNIYILLLRRWD